MAELTSEERKEAQKAFNQAALPILIGSLAAGWGLKLLGSRDTTMLALSVAVFFGGAVVAVVLGFQRRRRAVADILARRQSPQAKG